MLKKSRGAVGTVILLMLLFVLSACSNNNEAPVNSRAELVIGCAADITNLDGHMLSGTWTSSVANHVYDFLFRTSPEGTVEPLLVDTYEVIDDSTWQLKLKEGITFSNGEPFDAEVVAYNIERQKSDELGSVLASDYARIIDWVVVDEYTINLITDGIFPSLPLRLCNLGIVPMRYAEEVGTEGINVKPVGSGPYLFEAWVKDDHLTLVANEDYWGGAPQVKRVTFRVIPEASTRMLALQTGEIDIALTLPPSQADRLQPTDGLKVVSGPAGRIVFLGMNTVEDGNVMQDERVRKAVCMSINVQEILDTVLCGCGKEVAAVSLPNWLGFDPTIAPWEQDIEGAKALLAEAGYPNGVVIKLAVDPTSQPGFQEVADALAGQLGRAGFQVTVNTMDTPTLREMLINGTIDETYLMGLGGPTAENDSITRQIVQTGIRFSAYSDPNLDAIIEKAHGTLDQDKADYYWSLVQQEIMDKAIVRSLYQPHTISGARDGISWQPRVNEHLYTQEIVIE